MTLDEAINNYQGIANYLQRYYVPDAEVKLQITNSKCIEWFNEVTEWLTELKHLKAIIAGYGTVDMQKLDMILTMIRTESEDAWTRIEREKELKEAKRLLKAAVEDFTAIAEVHAAATPILCPQYGKYMKAIDVRTRKWRYEDEALKLIGGNENG